MKISAKQDEDTRLIKEQSEAVNKIECLTHELKQAQEHIKILREAAQTAREAMIVLSDETWELLVERPRRKDTDTIYAWSVGRYRKMREADALLAQVLSATSASAENQENHAHDTLKSSFNTSDGV